MQNAKSFLASRTVWGVVIALGAQVADRWGFRIDQELQDQTVDIILQVVSVAGAALAIYGRVKATKQLSLTGGPQ